MPPKSRGLGVERAEKGFGANNEPPPSTLAAQLVDNLSTRRQQPLHQNGREDLKLLLAEVHGFSDIPEGEIDIKTKIEQNQKTIFLFVRIIIDSLINEAPSAVTTQSLDHACKALEILKKTVQETPGVLAHVAGAGTSTYTGGEALWAWLFPRLLTLISRDYSASQSNSEASPLPEKSTNKVHELLPSEIASFFNLAFRVASGSAAREAGLGMKLFTYLKDRCNEVVSRISDPGLIANGPELNPQLVLPITQPAESMTLPEDPIQSAMSTYTMQDARIAHAHAASLLLILGNILSGPDMPYEAGLDHTAWIFDTIVSLNDSKQSWPFESIIQNNESKLCLLLLRTVRAIKLPSSSWIPTAVSCKSYMIISRLCADCLEEPAILLDDFINEILCPSLLELSGVCKTFEPVSETIKSNLLPTLMELTNGDDSYFAKHKDLKLCIRSLQEQTFFKKVSNLQVTFDDLKLNQQFRFLGLENGKSNQPDSPRPSKRRKTSTDMLSDHSRNKLDQITADISRLIDVDEAATLDDLKNHIMNAFTRLNRADQCRAIELLGWLPCAIAWTLEIFHQKGDNFLDAECSTCDCERAANQDHVLIDSKECQPVLEIMLALVRHLTDTKRQRILAMLALRRIATHFRDPHILDVETSGLGQWCVQCLQSSVRELRIAAGRTLPVFLREPLALEVLQKNRIHIIEVLRTLSNESPTHLQETCILAWGQVGRVSTDGELNLVLLRLVEYLGHVNPIVSGAAFNEIAAISAAAGVTPWKLFGPFWRSVAVTAIKDLTTRPQTTQLMADLLSFSIPDLLQNTQSYTLPWLVLSKKKDIIQRITQADGKSNSWEICFVKSKNLAPILAFLLVQPVTDQQAFIMALLEDVFGQKLDVSDLIKTAPIEIAFELLNASGDADESKKSRIRHAMQFLASVWEPTSTKPSKQAKKTFHVGPFLEQHILGLITHFSDAIFQNWNPAAEKRRCLRGIEETVKLGKSYITSALPQICALLQSALLQKDLRVTAFSTWATMVQLLDPEDVKTILESTFAVIIQHWQGFEIASQQCAHELVGFVLTTHRDLIQECFDFIPSLASIPSMAQYETELEKMKSVRDLRHRFQVFTCRIRRENATVVAQAFMELSHFLRGHQSFLQASAISEQPDKIVGELIRGILDSCIKFSDEHPDIARLSAECIGLVGCLDSNRVEAIRERHEIVVVSNFEFLDDTTDFVLFALEEVLVKAFLSATDSKAQNFLSFAMQDLLAKCNFSEVCAKHRPGDSIETSPQYRKWMRLPEPVRATLTPFLRSHYSLPPRTPERRLKDMCKYPIFQPLKKKYGLWLREFVLDLLQKAQNNNAVLVYDSFSRVIKIQDISPAELLLPYVVLHVIVSGTETQRGEIFHELFNVLDYELESDAHQEKETVLLCSEAVFRVLDYLSRWVQEKNVSIDQLRHSGGHTPSISSAETGITRITDVLTNIPPKTLSQRAVLCKSYARALVHWEAHVRETRGAVVYSEVKADIQLTPVLEHLQHIYTEIDEPDGIEGIAAHLHVLDIDQQIRGHRKAGRWTAAQNWYEIKLNEDPDNLDLQLDLLTCLKESGQHDVLLNYIEGQHEPTFAMQKLLPYATEASWITGKWDLLDKYLNTLPLDVAGDFNMTVGHLLGALHRQDTEAFTSTIANLRESIACRLSGPTTDSIHACRDSMLRLHVLTDLEMIAGTVEQKGRTEILKSLDSRLEVIGAYPNDKQYLLGIRRAAMQLVCPRFTNLDVASAWLKTAKLARKGNSINESYNAVLHALQLGDESATVEQARLLWKEGHARQAIQILQNAIATSELISHNRDTANESMDPDRNVLLQDEKLAAKTYLLLAKWLDSAGQTQGAALRSQYQLAAKTHPNWEKGHYYLGRHYNKLLESEKGLTSQSAEYRSLTLLTGETAKLVIDNYFRSLNHGTKYIYQTLPRILTLWLDLGTQVLSPPDKKQGDSLEFVTKVTSGRTSELYQVHKRVKKQIPLLPAYMFYTALPQIVARIAHPNADVVKLLQGIIVKVVTAHPQHALWCLFAVSTSPQADRKSRGEQCLLEIRKNKNVAPGGLSFNITVLRGERLAEQMLSVCNAGEFRENRTVTCSLKNDLRFMAKTCTPSPLAVPIESVLTATLPTLTDNAKDHEAFSRDVITIQSFADEVLVLSSLAKPRKLTARTSDGRSYGLMCKPKDDLRKDQRLMEFNSMINRSMKRDAESSKRQLYIKTYAVTPLNEECGIIEWVDGLKTLRDILLGLYKVIGIHPDYSLIKQQLDEASSDPSKIHRFHEVVESFPPVFHLWFVKQFPDPSAWFAARLKYSRSAAVMSMVGFTLGLGDRHTENILFEEGNGGTFHVDFNCLFDKGLSFVQPERVPFRLTHNMVDAMGIYGYEGPFRKSSELTLKLLRQHEETLMTILEAFIHDPTLDLLSANKRERKKREGVPVVPDNAHKVLHDIQRKMTGLLADESVPLSVEGQVDELIKQAVDAKKLTAMYIGWCAFF